MRIHLIQGWRHRRSRRPTSGRWRQRASTAIWGILLALVAAAPGFPACGDAPNGHDDGTEVTGDEDWRRSLARQASRALDNVDEYVDIQWRRFVRRMRFGQPRHIAAYGGYANRRRLWVSGRLLANRPYGGPREDDGWWDNLTATYNRWESDEIPGARIRLVHGDRTKLVTTDEEGYFHADFRIRQDSPQAGQVVALHEVGDRTLMAIHPVSLLEDRARFVLVSDMDDTVIHTGITDLLVAAQLTFLNNARTRKPLPGVASLYQALALGVGGDERNPVIYLSNSAWNMYDLLRDFLDLNELPEGPLLLRDIGRSSDSEDHKIETLRRLLRRYDPLPFMLIGDSGQHDAAIYSRVAEEHPDRVHAIYIRDIDPEDDSRYDGSVDGFIEASRADIPFLRVRDSAQIARHAAEIGLMNPSLVAGVEAAVIIDRQRDSLAEETSIGTADN